MVKKCRICLIDDSFMPVHYNRSKNLPDHVHLDHVKHHAVERYNNLIL
jgi:hypothetical protein